MHLQALLLSCLVSASLAGPTWKTSSQVDSCITECLPQNKFDYEIGKTYTYNYEASTIVNGAETGEVSTRFTSTVLIQPISSCEVILSMKDVVLNSKKTDEFAMALTKEPTKFSYQNGKVESVCSSQSEPVWISNIKKAVISSFQNSMTTLEESEMIMEKDISGDCETEYKAQKDEEGKMVIFRTKDLNKCMNKEYSTIKRLSAFGYSADAFLNDAPLLDSKQTCKQTIENGVVFSVKCDQTFELHPFNIMKYVAVTNVSTKLNLYSVTSDLPNKMGRFDHKSDLMFQTIEKEDKTSTFSAVVDILNRLEFLSDDGVTSEVPVLFSELVTKLRKLETSEIQTILNQSDKTAQQFLKDALILVKTHSSMKVIINLIKDNMLGEKDSLAWVTSLSFVKKPTLEMFKNLQPLVETKYGVKSILGLSSMIHNYCSENKNCEEKYEVTNIITSIESFLGNGCRPTTEQEKEDILMALKALGNAGLFKNSESILIRCYKEENPIEIRIAAIEAWRRAPSSYDRNHLLEFFMDQSKDTEIRIAAYLAVMKYPTKSVIESVKEALTSEAVNQVASFVWTHLTNLQESAFPEKQAIRELIGEELLQQKFKPEALKFSSNYESSFEVTQLGGMAESNLIFSSQSYLPRSAMFNLTVDLFGESINLFEFGGRMEGFETYIEKFFGKDGYYPEETVAAILENLRQSKNEGETVLANYLSQTSDDPHGSMYLKIFGNELLYKHFNGMSDLMPMIGFENPIEMMIELFSKGNVDFTKSFSIIDADVNYPTISGFPLNLNLNGAATLGMKMDGKFDFNGFSSMNINGKIQPSAAIKIDGSMAIDSFVSKTGVKISSSLHSSTLIQGKIVVKDGKVIDVKIDVPKEKIDIIDFNNEIYRIEDGEEIKTDINTDTNTNCQEILGIQFCYSSDLSKAKLYIEKIDSHTSYRFYLENQDNIKSLLFEMPNSQNDIKYSASLNRKTNALQFNWKSPSLSFDSAISYDFGDIDKTVDAEITMNEQVLYTVSAKYSFIKNQLIEGFFKVDSPFAGNLLKFDLLLSNNKEEDMKKLKLEVKTPMLPTTQSLNMEYTGKNKNRIFFDLNTIYLQTSVESTIVPTGNRKSIQFAGRYQSMLEDSPNTFTGFATMNKEIVDEGMIYSGKLDIEEIGLISTWKFEKAGNKWVSRISGQLLEEEFNLDEFYLLTKTKNAYDLQIKSNIKFPATKTDIDFARSFHFGDKSLKSVTKLKVNDLYNYDKSIEWNFGESVTADVSMIIFGNTYSSYFDVRNKEVNLRKMKFNLNLPNIVETEADLTFSTKPGKFNSILNAKGTIHNQSYNTSWKVNADSSELNLEGKLESDAKLSTIFAKATPKSININNTFYKPLSIEANMETLAESKEFMITASSEQHSFRTSGKISPKNLQGSIKAGKYDLGLTGSIQDNGIELSSWWSPNEKFIFSTSLNTGAKTEFLASLMTPFQGFEKQDVKLTFEMNRRFKIKEGKAQVSVTWGNENHLTITSDYSCDITDIIAANFKVSSTLDKLERIDISTKIYINEKRAEVRGILNKENINADMSLKTDNDYTIANLDIKSTLFKKVQISIQHDSKLQNGFTSTITIKHDLNTHTAKLFTKYINICNFETMFSLSSPSIPKVSIEAKIDGMEKEINVKGIFDQKQFLLEGEIDKSHNEYEILLKSSIDSFILLDFSVELKKSTDFCFEANMNLNSSFSSKLTTKAHVEGKFESFYSASLDGFLSSYVLDGILKLKHSIVNKKLDSTLEFDLNTFSLNINSKGQFNVEKMSGTIDFSALSSLNMLKQLKISLDTDYEGNTRTSTIVVSAGDKTVNIDHELTFEDIMNWKNIIIVNNFWIFRNEMLKSSNVVKHVSEINYDGNVIKLEGELTLRRNPSINIKLLTPWTSSFSMEANNLSTSSKNKGILTISYGEITSELTGEYSRKYESHVLEFGLDSNKWNNTPLRMQLKWKANIQEVEFSIIDSKSRTFTVMFENGSKKQFYVEYKGEQTYNLGITFDGNLKKGMIMTEVMHPYSSLKSTINYKYEPMDIDFEAVNYVNENNYDLNFTLRTNELRLWTQCPQGKTNFSSTWKVNNEKMILGMNLVTSDMIKRSLDFFKDGNNYNLTYLKNEDKFSFNGTFNRRSIEISGSTPINGFKIIQLNASMTQTSFNCDFSADDKKYTIASEMNLNSLRAGSFDVTVKTPYVSFENNKLFFKYSFNNSQSMLSLNGDVGNKKFFINHLAHVAESKGKITLEVSLPEILVGDLSLNALFENNMINIVGEYGTFNFDWTLKAFYGHQKSSVTMKITSNIPRFNSYIIAVEFNFQPQNYGFNLSINDSGYLAITTSSITWSQEDFNIEVQSHLAQFRSVKASGKYTASAGQTKLYTKISVNDKEIHLSTLINNEKDIPEINFKLQTPFQIYNNIEFKLNGSLNDEKSISILSSIDEKQYAISVSIKENNVSSKKMDVSIETPFNGFKSIQISGLYNLNSNMKIAKLNYIWDKDSLNFTVKCDSDTIDIELESSIDEIKPFKINGTHYKITNGYKGEGSFTKNGKTLDFNAKAIVQDDEFDIEFKLPIEEGSTLKLQGFLKDNQIKTIMTKGNGFFSKEYNLEINYLFDSQTAHVHILTPFEFLSSLELKFKSESNDLQTLINFTKYTESYGFTLSANVEPLESNIAIVLKAPEINYDLSFEYDLSSDEKYIQFYREKNGEKVEMSIKSLLLTKSPKAYLLIESSFEDYRKIGFEYDLSPIKSLKNIDTYIAIYNDDVKYIFRLKSEFEVGTMKFFIETPIGGYEKIGFNAIKNSEGIDIGAHFGSIVFELKALPIEGQWLMNIETPIKIMNLLVNLSYKWENQNKYGIFKVKYDNKDYEINVTIRNSWENPEFTLKFDIPFEIVPKTEIKFSYNIHNPEFVFRFSYNELTYMMNGKLSLGTSKFVVNLDAETPLAGWRDVEFLCSFNSANDNKLIIISLERDGQKKEISLNGMLTDSEMTFLFKNPFENIPDIESNASLDRSKRSLNLFMDVKKHVLDMRAGFHSLKLNIRTPYEKAKNVVFELSKKEDECSLHYERNDNFVDFKVIHKGKKKGISLTIKSATPGWELLALTGRLDLSEVKAYVSGHKNEKKIELEGSGSFSEKSGTLKMIATTPFEKFKKVNINFDYNAKRKIVTFEATSDSSDFHILLEFKRGLTIDIYVPHPETATNVKGKFSLFKGDLEGSSRFPAFKTIQLHYSINLGSTITAKVLYERNGLKIFELEAERDGQANTAHIEIHGRRNGNHSKFFFHKEQLKNIEVVFNRNGKEFKIVIKGTGDLPKSGKLEFTIDNSFRETPRHISGSLEVERTTSPKSLHLIVEYPGSKRYGIHLEYNINLGKLKKGDFKMNISTPTKDRRIWKSISADWKLSKDNVLDGSVTAGPLTFKITGKIGLLDTDLTVQNTANKNEYFVKWQINRKPKGRDYLIKVGKLDRFVKFEFHGEFDTIKNGDVYGNFIATRFMKNELIFNEKWSTDANGKTTGNGDFELGDKKGTTNWSWKRNAANRAAILHWEATSNIKNYNSAKMHIEYSLAERMVNILISRDSEKIAFSTSLDNFSKLSSSNIIKGHLPTYGDGELTLSHDFTNPMAKSVKAVGSIGGKKISYIANWTRDENLTEFDFNLEVDSAIFGLASLHAAFDIKNLKDATANLHYKRGDKFVNIDWHRKRTANDIENEMKFSSSFKLLPTARIFGHAEWSKGFHLMSSVEWNEKSINSKLDFQKGKLTASITTPFEKVNDITFSLEYNLKMKNKFVVLHYARGEKKVDMEFKLNLANKKNGKLSFELTTPFKVLEHVTIDGQWKKGKFNADYKRNDIEVHFEGEAEVKLEKSKMHLKFTPPSGNPVDLSFSYDLQKFVEGKSQKSNRLIDFDLKVAGQTIHFTIDGFRNTDKIFVEVNGNTSLDKLSSFYVKVDSELNLTDRVGHFEVRANEFHFKAENSFEKRKNGFYARTALDSSLTKLPGLIIGFGKEGDNFIATVGYGEDREVTVSFKGKNHFKKGFSGKIDIPKRGINDLVYDVSYGFEGQDEFKTTLRIDTSDDRHIEADIIYNSEGVKARVLSPFGNHSARVKRSISDNSFSAEFELDDQNFTIEGLFVEGRKGFMLNGQLFGHNFDIDTFYSGSRKEAEGKLHILIPYMQELSSSFSIGEMKKNLNGDGQIIYGLNKMSIKVDFDFDRKIKGDALLNINEYSYIFTTDMIKANNNYEGTLLLKTPHNNLKKISAIGSLYFKNGFKDTTGDFRVEFNDKVYDVTFSHTIEKDFSNFNVSFVNDKQKEITISLSYPTNFNVLKTKLYMIIKVANVQIFKINTTFDIKSWKEMNGNFEIESGIPLMKFEFDSYKSANHLQVAFIAKLFENNEFLFRFDTPTNNRNETTKFEFVLKSLKFTTIKTNVILDSENEMISADFIIDGSKGPSRMIIEANNFYSFFERNNKSFKLNADIYMPNKPEKSTFKMTFGLDKNAVFGNAKLVENNAQHSFKFNFEIDHSTSTKICLGRIQLDTPIFMINSVDFKGFLSCQRIKVDATSELKLFGATHSSLFTIDFANKVPSFTAVLRSPILPSEFVRVEFSYDKLLELNGRAYLVYATKDITTSADITLNMIEPKYKELLVEIKTPFNNYKNNNFELKYSNDEISSFSLLASPINIKAGCFFGVRQDVFSAGIEMDTHIDKWELTKLETEIPLNEFSPKFAAKVNGNKYELDVHRNKTQFGGLISVKVVENEKVKSGEFDYRYKAPYHVRANIMGNERFVAFDSSFILPIMKLSY